MTRPFIGITVTLTTATTAYNLIALVQAAELVLHANDVVWDGTCAMLELMADTGNGSANIFVGGSDVTTTNYGYQLIAGGSRQYGPFPMSCVASQGIYVVADTNSTVLHVEAMAI